MHCVQDNGLHHCKLPAMQSTTCAAMEQVIRSWVSSLHILTQYAFVGCAQVLLAQLGWMELKEHYYAPAGIFRLDHFTGQHL